MKDFITGALPFVTIGICIAIIFATHKEEKKDYMLEGMLIGFAIGVVLEFILKVNFLNIYFMMIGETIGSVIKKKDKPTSDKKQKDENEKK